MLFMFFSCELEVKFPPSYNCSIETQWKLNTRRAALRIWQHSSRVLPHFEIEMKMKINKENVQIHHTLSKIKVKFHSHTSQQVRNVVIGLHRVRIARQYVYMLKKKNWDVEMLENGYWNVEMLPPTLPLVFPPKCRFDRCTLEIAISLKFKSPHTQKVSGKEKYFCWFL